MRSDSSCPSACGHPTDAKGHRPELPGARAIDRMNARGRQKQRVSDDNHKCTLWLEKYCFRQKELERKIFKYLQDYKRSVDRNLEEKKSKIVEMCGGMIP